MPGDTDQVIELSVEETNRLRAELGLKPLQTSKSNGDKAAVLELSVDESNRLRAELGLKPLHSDQSKEPIHRPPTADDADARERLERARLARAVKAGMAKFAASGSLADEHSSARSWARQMRTQKAQRAANQANESSHKASDYSADDLKGINVAHSLGELAQGSTTVLTLADESLLEQDEHSKKALGLREDGPALENIDLAEARRQQDGLQAKRQMELGQGRAGGYAGFDDDEFEELGGVSGPSRSRLGLDSSKHKRPRGFQIGAMLQEAEEEQESELFAGPNKAISLQPGQADTVASDFMSVEEDEALRKKKKKDATFKKKKKKDKKKKRKHRRQVESDDEEEEDEEAPAPKSPPKGILEELEETAVEEQARKRRRLDEGDEDDGPSVTRGDKPAVDKRAKFEAVMAKGNERTKLAFQSQPKRPVEVDEEPDDAFLNAALAKARRLNRLKSLSSKKGADAVMEAVHSAQQLVPDPATSGGGTVEFSVDETSEFTRALRARAEQAEREQAKKTKREDDVGTEKAKTAAIVKQEDESEDEDVNMEELARDVKEEPMDTTGGLEGTSGATVPIGRGLGSVLGMLAQTGELKRRNAGKEEMRGRAKDRRTYEDYEALDLKQVVKIDERTATDKDKEFARREVKLEYRDKHGRLLTRKEAFRDLSYQFHGHAGGKRKDEKRREQIAREQAEARHAAEAGTLSALKATQKATGKAFVVHKT